MSGAEDMLDAAHDDEMQYRADCMEMKWEADQERAAAEWTERHKGAPERW